MINHTAAVFTILAELAALTAGLAIYGAYRICRDITTWADRQRLERAWLKAVERNPWPQWADNPQAAPEPIEDILDRLFTTLGPPHDPDLHHPRIGTNQQDLNTCHDIWNTRPEGDPQ